MARHCQCDGGSGAADIGGGRGNQAASPSHANEFRLAATARALVLATAAASTPLVAGGFWIADGTGDVLHAGPVNILPPFVAAESVAHGQARTVVLKPGPSGQVDYTVLRDRNQQLGDADLQSDPGQVAIVGAAVADLSAGIGQRAATELSHAGIRYVLVPESADAGLGARIAAGGGVLPQNTSGGWRVWEVQANAGRLAIAATGDDDWQLPGDPVGVGRHAPALQIPFSLGSRVLVLTEAPSSAWQAKAVAAPGPIGRGGRCRNRRPAWRGRCGPEPRPSLAHRFRQRHWTACRRSPCRRLRRVSWCTRSPDRHADWLLFELAVLLLALLGAIPAGGRAGEQRRPGRPVRSALTDPVPGPPAEVAHA